MNILLWLKTLFLHSVTSRLNTLQIISLLLLPLFLSLSLILLFMLSLLLYSMCSHIILCPCGTFRKLKHVLHGEHVILHAINTLNSDFNIHSSLETDVKAEFVPMLSFLKISVLTTVFISLTSPLLTSVPLFQFLFLCLLNLCVSLVEFSVKVLQWSDKEKVRLQLWDIAGTNTFHSGRADRRSPCSDGWTTL